MSKTKEEILQAKTAHEVFEWLKEDESHQVPEVFAYFDMLRKKEFEKSVIEVFGSYDPDMHYDFFEKRKK